MGFLDLFKPKRDPPKPKVRKNPSTTSTGPSKFPKTIKKWKDRPTTCLIDCLELFGDIIQKAGHGDD